MSLGKRNLPMNTSKEDKAERRGEIWHIVFSVKNRYNQNRDFTDCVETPDANEPESIGGT